jgi:hypothetical protein
MSDAVIERVQAMTLGDAGAPHPLAPPEMSRLASLTSQPSPLVIRPDKKTKKRNAQ